MSADDLAKLAECWSNGDTCAVNPQDCDEDASNGQAGGWAGRIGRFIFEETVTGMHYVHIYGCSGAAHRGFACFINAYDDPEGS